VPVRSSFALLFNRKRYPAPNLSDANIDSGADQGTPSFQVQHLTCRNTSCFNLQRFSQAVIVDDIVLTTTIDGDDVQRLGHLNQASRKKMVWLRQQN